MIDLHCHILPGVDDGARTLDESLEMARQAVATGTRKLVATPHMLHPMFHVPGDRARRRLKVLRAALAEARIDLEVGLAGEIHWSAEVQQRLATGELIPYAEERKYILFELPSTHVPDAFREQVFRLQTAAIFPVLAHPERNRDFERDPDRVHAIRDAGVPVQVTAMSLTGAFGRKAKKVSRRWLKEGAIDLVASDGHRSSKRPPCLDEAARLVRKLAGPSVEEWLTCEVPRRILAGEAVFE